MNDPNTNMPLPTSFGVTPGTAPASTNQAAATVSAVKDAAGDVAGQAKQQAGSIVDQVKDKVLTAATEQKQGLADQIDGLADSIHNSGQQFAGQQDWIASAIERGATELGTLATALRDNDLGSLYGQVRSMARQQPALFIGACLAGGFALARVGKLVADDVSRDDLPTMPEVGHGGQ